MKKGSFNILFNCVSSNLDFYNGFIMMFLSFGFLNGRFYKSFPNKYFLINIIKRKFVKEYLEVLAFLRVIKTGFQQQCRTFVLKFMFLNHLLELSFDWNTRAMPNIAGKKTTSADSD